MVTQVRIKEEDNLEQVVKETAPQTATQQILHSSAWNNKENHNKGCVNPQLAEVKNQEEEQTRTKVEPTPMLQEVLQEETKPIEEVEEKKTTQEQFAATQGKSGDYLSAGTPMGSTHKGSNDYMGNEFFEAGCTCGAEIHVNPAEQHMASGDLVTDSNTYDKNVQSEGTQTNYGTNTSDQSGEQTKMKSGSMMYEDKNKTGGYVP